MKKASAVALSAGIGLILAFLLVAVSGAAGPKIGVATWRVLPAPIEDTICAQGTGEMCLYVYTGTVRAVHQIGNPGGISGFKERHFANFDQYLISQSSTSIEVETISRYYIDTLAPYPVDIVGLPSGIRDSYLGPESSIQSTHPEIVAKARELVQGATRQAEATEAILTWVRAHISYDYSFSLPNDALSVFRNRSGVCAGFSTVSTALLRAAGIPSRYQRGCATPQGYVTGDGGGWHAWIEVYYPDLGWIPSEPQVSANVMGPVVIYAGFDQCGSGSTEITADLYGDTTPLWRLPTSYDDSVRSSFTAATVPHWEREVLLTPPSVGAMVSISNPIGHLSVWATHLDCYYPAWQVRTDAPWLSPSILISSGGGAVQFAVDATGMMTGTYEAEVTIYATSAQDKRSLGTAVSRTIPAQLWVVDRIYSSYLPIVAKN